MNKAAPKPITFQPDIYDKVLSLLGQGPLGRVLDVGAGQGYFCDQLTQRGVTIEACDFSTENFLCPHIPFRQANLNERLPYEDNQFDCVISIEVVEHVENHFKFMSEILRVTKPGGTVIITTPNVLSMTSRLHFFLYGYTDCAPLPLDPYQKEYFMQHINPISLPELLFHIERFGGELQDVTTNRLRRSSYLPMVLYPLLSFALKRKLLRGKYLAQRSLHERHIKWMLKPANLMGRITIIVARKK